MVALVSGEILFPLWMAPLIRLKMASTIGQTIEEGFWRHAIVKDGGCWGWNGATDKDGYGKFDSKGSTISGHRASFMVHYGNPEWAHVLHRCDNPICCNPEHLFLGTHQDNMDDASAKGAWANRKCNRNKSPLE